MGYYTYFDLTVEPRNADGVIREAIAEKLNGYDVFDGDRHKWYEWKDDMSAVSKNHEHVLLVLDGDGEGQGDRWRAFFINGSCQVHRAPKWEPPSEPTLEWNHRP